MTNFTPIVLLSDQKKNFRSFEALVNKDGGLISGDLCFEVFEDETRTVIYSKKNGQPFDISVNTTGSIEHVQNDNLAISAIAKAISI